MRGLVGGVALGLVVLAAAARADEPYVLPKREISLLESLGRRMARSGRARPVRDLLDVLSDCGVERERIAKLEEACDRSLDKSAGKQRISPQSEARALQRVVKGAEGALEKAPGARKTSLARIILRLDGSSAAAHEALGHVRHRGEWLPKHLVPLRERREEIDAAIQRIRRLPVEIEVRESDTAMFQQLHGRKGICAVWKGVQFHSYELGEEKLRRMLREVLRACALTNFVCHGKAEIPDFTKEKRFAFTREQLTYEAWVKRAVLNRSLSADHGERALKEACFWGARGTEVYSPMTEARLEAFTFDSVWYEFCRQTWRREPQPALEAGHLHWVCLRYLGTGIPSFVWVESTTKVGTGETKTGAQIRMTIEREEMERVGRAGLRGLKRWMIWLARRHEDPPFRDAMQAHVGAIEGNVLLKATTVVEFLHERNAFMPLAKATLQAQGTERDRAAAFEQALGHPLAELEAQWREWLIPIGADSLLELLGGGDDGELSPEQNKLLAHLNAIRLAALDRGAGETGVRPVTLDEELSEGAVAHALYLERNPKQLELWPDAHEEFADREGFSPAGNWAGNNSVIAPGSKGPVDAIDGWMSTFYHRLPLLDPGLQRVGWGLRGGVAVLDSGSLVAPAETQQVVLWPPDGAKDVPTQFAPELPHPVPGEDQSNWGYPITLQIFAIEPAHPAEMVLSREKDGPAVAAHYSTPSNPTNPNLAPSNAYCLIPKQRLQPGTTYHVKAHHPGTGKFIRWTFRTGR